MHTVNALRTGNVPAFSDIQDVFGYLEHAGVSLRVIAPLAPGTQQTPLHWVHEENLMRIRRFRGAVCLSEGILPPEAVDASGCHFLACDHLNYHLMMVDRRDKLVSCLRMRIYAGSGSAADLQLYKAVRRMPSWISSRCSNSMNLLIQGARRRAFKLVELGGFAVAAAHKEGPAMQMLPLAAIGLSQMLGNAILFEHAGADTHNTSVLRSCGDVLCYDGLPIPATFDEQHGRLMQIYFAVSAEPKPASVVAVTAMRELLKKELSSY